MISVKMTIVLILAATLALAPSCDAWRRRRRRRPPPCAPRNCQVSHWSYWSLCSADGCGQQGFQTRSRRVVSPSSCRGAQCPLLRETRQCYGSTPVDCVVSLWAEWSACTTVCGGIQISSRHRITTEQCGGSCTSTFSKTRSCRQTSCFNGGSFEGGICFCKERYSGSCCENHYDASTSTRPSSGHGAIIGGACGGVVGFCTLIYIAYIIHRWLSWRPQRRVAPFTIVQFHSQPGGSRSFSRSYPPNGLPPPYYEK